MSPQKRPRRLPFLVGGTFEEPRGGPIVMGLTSGVMIYRWIRGGKPLVNSSLQEIT
jgi:hypothetical protein